MKGETKLLTKRLKNISRFIVLIVVLVLTTSTVAFAKGQQPTNTLSTNGNGGKTDVGIWYVTYNNSSMWGNNFGSGFAIRYRAQVSDNPVSYGIADSSSIEQIDMHLRMFAEAKIDFIVFDLTNGGLTKEVEYGTTTDTNNGNEWIVDNAKLTCQRIANWNQNNEWKIKYAVAVGTYSAINGGRPDGMTAELQAKAVWKDFVENEEYGGDNYYHLDEKPLLIIHDWGENDLEKWEIYGGDRTYGDKFTVRNGQGGEVGTYGWQTRYGTIVHDEVELICAGWGNASGDSTIPRENGAYYQRNWDIILDNQLPRIVMIAAFNDFNERLAVMPADTSLCDEENTPEEQWRDADGNLSPTMYWDMTVEGIKQVRIINGEMKGDSPINNTTWLYVMPIAITLIAVLVAVTACVMLVKQLKRYERNRVM